MHVAGPRHTWLPLRAKYLSSDQIPMTGHRSHGKNVHFSAIGTSFQHSDLCDNRPTRDMAPMPSQISSSCFYAFIYSIKLPAKMFPWRAKSEIILLQKLNEFRSFSFELPASMEESGHPKLPARSCCLTLRQEHDRKQTYTISEPLLWLCWIVRFWCKCVWPSWS